MAEPENVFGNSGTQREASEIVLAQAATPHLWAAAADLVREYADSLDISLDFQDFSHELAQLPKVYGPPHGVFLLAQTAERFVGCGAIRRCAEAASLCEMKRLYVSPHNQNRGIGRMLAEALLAEARSMGYRAIVLDTLPSMQGAQALYRSLGFQPVAAYRYNPVVGATFMRLAL